MIGPKDNQFFVRVGLFGGIKNFIITTTKPIKTSSKKIAR